MLVESPSCQKPPWSPCILRSGFEPIGQASDIAAGETHFPWQLHLLRGTSDGNRELSRFYPPLSSNCVVVGEGSSVERNRSRLLFPCFYINFHKSLEFLYRSWHVRVHIADINLCDLRALSMPSVLDGERYSHIAWITADLKVAVLKGCVRETVPEGE